MTPDKQFSTYLTNVAQSNRALIYGFLIFIFIWLTLPAFADNVSKPSNLQVHKQSFCSQRPSLSQLTDLALTHNPNTAIAWAQIKMAVANLGIKKSLYWPHLYANLNLTYGSNNAFKDDDNSNRRSNNANYTPSLSLNYLVFDFGSRANNVKAAKYQVIAAQFSDNASIQQVILAVDQAYYQLLGQQAMVDLGKQTIIQAKASLDSAVALHQQGMATIGDVYQAQSTLAQAKLNLRTALGQLAIDKGQLAYAVGLPVQTKLCITKLPEHLQTKPFLQSLTRLLKKAQTTRPDLLAARAEVKADAALLSATKAQAWPTLQLSANTGQTCPVEGVCNYGYQSSVTLSLNIPLFTGFSQTNAVHQAKALRDQAQAQQALLANQVGLQVWQAYYSLQTAYQAVQSSETLLQSSYQAAKQALGQYRAGVGNILSVLTTQTAQTNAQAQNIKAKLDWYLATVELAQALGELTSTTAN